MFSCVGVKESDFLLQALSLEGCVALTDDCLPILAKHLPLLAQLDCASIELHNPAVLSLAPLRHLCAVRLRPHIDRSTIRSLTQLSLAPVWGMLIAAPPSQRWCYGFDNSRLGGFDSRVWKIPGHSVHVEDGDSQC
jgi:hypothetical protein